MDYNLYSFDVFDTLITRNTATPNGIFACMQQELKKEKYSHIDPSIRNNFARMRIRAESAARHSYQNCGVEDVTLEQIYQAFETRGIGKEDLKLFCDLERETEENHVFGISHNIDKVIQLLKQKKRVILISDMYLDSDTIRRMLQKANEVFKEIPLYVSSEYRKGKWTGHLFQEIQQLEKVDFTNWTHYGDNEQSDFQIPQNLGIHCERWEFESLTELERRLVGQQEALMEWNVTAQLAIGSARNVRLEKGCHTIAEKMGIGVGGMVLYPYLDWVLKESLKRKISDLYFIARDGYLLKLIADVMIGVFHLKIRTHYIYGSRAAWRIPAIVTSGLDILDIYERSYQDRIRTLEELADFFQISKEELLQYIPGELSLNDKTFTKELLDVLVHHLNENQEFKQLLTRYYDQKRKIVVEYMQQEIQDGDSNIAFVDLAGTGFTQKCLACLTGDTIPGDITTFFYRMDGIRKTEGCNNLVFYPFYYDHSVVLEMLCRAPHGQTAGYEYSKDGKIIPTLTDVDTQAIIKHGVPEYIEGVTSFVAQLAKVSERTGINSFDTSVMDFYLCQLLRFADKAIMDFIGDMPNMLTGREKKSYVYAPRLGKADIKRIFLLREDYEPLEACYYGSEYDFTLKRMSHEDQKRMLFYQKYRNSLYGYLNRKWYHFICHVKGKEQAYYTIYDFLEPVLVIYGAGKIGTKLYNQLKKDKKHKIVMWVDQQYKKHQESGLPVVSQESLKDSSYDQVLIGVANRSVAEQIKKQLVEIGVVSEKIWWFPPDII